MVRVSVRYVSVRDVKLRVLLSVCVCVCVRKPSVVWAIGGLLLGRAQLPYNCVIDGYG